MGVLLERVAERDRAFLCFMVGRRHPLLDRAVRAITHLGDALTTIGVVAVLLALGAAVAYVTLFALVTSHLAVQLLKRTVSRPRPVLPVGIGSLIDAPDRFSFPSGHAASSLSVAIGLGLMLPLGGALLLLGLAFLVGMSRCYLGVHYPGDVAAGWALAAGAAMAGLNLL